LSDLSAVSEHHIVIILVIFPEYSKYFGLLVFRYSGRKNAVHLSNSLVKKSPINRRIGPQGLPERQNFLSPFFLRENRAPATAFAVFALLFFVSQRLVRIESVVAFPAMLS